MEVQKNNHLSVARLEDGVPDIVVKDVHLITSDRCVTESISVCFQGPENALLCHIGTDVEVFELRVGLVLWQQERVLFDEILLFFFLGFAGFELLLHFFNQAKSRVQISRWSGYLSGLFDVCAPVGSD